MNFVAIDCTTGVATAHRPAGPGKVETIGCAKIPLWEELNAGEAFLDVAGLQEFRRAPVFSYVPPPPAEPKKRLFEYAFTANAPDEMLTNEMRLAAKSAFRRAGIPATAIRYHGVQPNHGRLVHYFCAKVAE